MRNEQYPLHIAAKKGQIDVIDELLKKHDINERDENGNTPLHCAVSEMQDQAAVHLLEKRADASLVNKVGDTALHLYAAGGDQRGAAILNSGKKSAFSAKAIYIANAKGETPLHIAVTRDNMYFFTHFVNPLGRRYYESIDFKNNAFLNGPEGDSLVYVALRRLFNPALQDNENRTYTMLYLLAGEIPEMFSFKRAISFLSSQTPAEFSQDQKMPERITSLIVNAHKIYQETYGQKQMLGQLQQTLNQQTDLIHELQREVSQLKNQLAQVSRGESKPLSQLFLPAQSNNIGSQDNRQFGMALNNNNE